MKYNTDLFNSFPNAVQDYTFVQSSERMRRLRQKFFPATPDSIEDFHLLLMANTQLAMILQNPSSNKFLFLILLYELKSQQ